MMYRTATRLSAFLMIVLGAAMIVVTIIHGVAVAGLLLGALFIAAGALRYRMLRRRDG